MANTARWRTSLAAAWMAMLATTTTLLAPVATVTTAATALLLAPTNAHAGRSCEQRQAEPRQAAKALDLAKKTYDALDASGAQVVLVSRIGTDLSRYGLKYSHLGIVWRDHPRGRWQVVHELNECQTAISGLFDEGLGGFFLDDMIRYEALILIPNPELQQRLAQVLASGQAAALHHRDYNLVAYPFATRYQNSNQWVLEVIAAAMAPERRPITREQAQAWLKFAGFTPTTLNLPATTRLGGRMFAANVAFDDHPGERRWSDQIDVVSVDAVVKFLQAQNAVGDLREIR